ncbi:MAG: hypothetical protein AAB489_03740 [Patescibacteria group bacterium]
MENILLSPERSVRVLTVGISAAAALYLIAALVTEPMRGFAATDVNGKVSVTVTATASSLTCTDANGDSNGDDENLTIGSIGVGQDTGNYATTKDIHCNVKSNNSAGYTLAWRITTGSGGTSTGYMISQFEDKISPFRYNNSNDSELTATQWSTNVAATDADWGARLSSTSSSFSEDHASRQITNSEWGADGGSEKWARVASGSSVIFASSTNETTDAGDDHFVGFRTEIGSSRMQPSGTYQVEVDFTTANDL